MTLHNNPINNGSSNKQWINDNITITLERKAAEATAEGVGLDAFYWRQIKMGR